METLSDLLTRSDSAIAMLNFASSQVLPATLVIYGGWRYHWTSRQVGALLAVCALVGALMQGVVVRPVVRRFGERATLYVGLFGTVTSFVVVAAAPSPLVAIVGFLFGGIGGFARPAIQSLMSQTVDQGEQGRLSGAMTSLSGIAGILTPTIFTTVLAWSMRGGRLAPHLPLQQQFY